MKKLMSLALLCSMTVGIHAADAGSADAEKCCNSCNTCPTTTTTCNNCNSCGCKTVLTAEEEAAGEQRCACNKPKPGRSEVGDADAEKCCNSCNTCPTTTTTTCNSCNSCGCKTVLTAEEEAAGVARCACSKPKPGRSEVGDADAEKCCNSCNTCPTTTTTTCNSCNSCGCKTVLTEAEEAAGEQRCACSSPRPGGRPDKPPRSEVGDADEEQRCACSKPKPGRMVSMKTLAEVTVAKKMQENN